MRRRLRANELSFGTGALKRIPFVVAEAEMIGNERMRSNRGPMLPAGKGRA